MRALTHVTGPAAPDYRLRVPGRLPLVLALGLAAGPAGLGLILGAPAVPAVYGALLLGCGVLGATTALALGVITGPRLRERARRRMLDAVAWRGDERVLDVGCGNGFLLVGAAKHLTTGTATGIDVWKTAAGAQTAAAARRNAQLEGVADRVEIRQADARVMPFEDSTFDVIVSSLMLHHAGGGADRRQVLREMVRVLQPGGTILLYDAWPLITGAARQLRARGLTSTKRSGGVMALLSARRPEAQVAATSSGVGAESPRED